MLEPATFAIEEYNAIQTKIRQARDTLTRLEIVTIGGTVVASGILLGIGVTSPGTVPIFAWWSLILILLAAGFRCWAYYIYVWRLQTYVMQIEEFMRNGGYELEGFETFNRGKVAGPFLAHAINYLVWACLVGAVLLLAIWKSVGKSVP